MKNSNHVLACAFLLSLSGFLNAEVISLVDRNELLNAELISERATLGGLKSINYYPFERRFEVNSRFADLTCAFENASGEEVDEPDDGNDFTLVIDRIAFAEGEDDPNFDAQENPVRRSYPVASSGSINLFFDPAEQSSNLVVLDLCTSGASCLDGEDAPRLACREAGVLVFRDPFG